MSSGVTSEETEQARKAESVVKATLQVAQNTHDAAQELELYQHLAKEQNIKAVWG